MSSTGAVNKLIYIVIALALTPVIQQFTNSVNVTGSTALSILVPLIPLAWILAVVVFAFRMGKG